MLNDIAKAQIFEFGGGNPWSRHAARTFLAQLGPIVYAVRCPGGIIKIGHTTQPAERMAHLDGDLIAFRFGTYDDEQNVHMMLERHVHHGREWYYPTPTVMAFVNSWRADLGLDPVL